MRTSTLLVVSALFWASIFFWNDQSILAAIAIVAHGLSWQIHRIEVKLNKLLDDRGIYVTESELRE